MRTCRLSRPTIRGSGLPIPVNEQLQSPHAIYEHDGSTQAHSVCRIFINMEHPSLLAA
ncbi:MAG: hypothetical protein J1E78_08090 [Muribaculaceae bacterium]|nr:hypothetical protein [Muribaculaceae bacterium]